MDMCVCPYCHRPHHGVKMCNDVTAQYEKEEREAQEKLSMKLTKVVQKDQQQVLPFTLN